MPITQSAQKAIRGSLRKKAFNDSRKRAMKEVIKKIEAAQKNVIKKNNAARKKSRLSRLVKA